jgi:hypothetical protein
VQPCLTLPTTPSVPSSAVVVREIYIEIDPSPNSSSTPRPLFPHVTSIRHHPPKHHPSCLAPCKSSYLHLALCPVCLCSTVMAFDPAPSTPPSLPLLLPPAAIHPRHQVPQHYFADFRRERRACQRDCALALVAMPSSSRAALLRAIGPVVDRASCGRGGPTLLTPTSILSTPPSCSDVPYPSAPVSLASPKAWCRCPSPMRTKLTMSKARISASSASLSCKFCSSRSPLLPESPES